MLEFSTEDGQFQVLFILLLVLPSDGKCRFNQIYPMTPLVDKLDACARLSGKLNIYGDKWKP